MVYPVVGLRALGLGARAYVEGLEDCLIRVAGVYGLHARVPPPPPPPSPVLFGKLNYFPCERCLPLLILVRRCYARQSAGKEGLLAAVSCCFAVLAHYLGDFAACLPQLLLCAGQMLSTWMLASSTCGAFRLSSHDFIRAQGQHRGV